MTAAQTGEDIPGVSASFWAFEALAFFRLVTFVIGIAITPFNYEAQRECNCTNLAESLAICLAFIPVLTMFVEHFLFYRFLGWRGVAGITVWFIPAGATLELVGTIGFCVVVIRIQDPESNLVDIDRLWKAAVVVAMQSIVGFIWLVGSFYYLNYFRLLYSQRGYEPTFWLSELPNSESIQDFSEGICSGSSALENAYNRQRSLGSFLRPEDSGNTSESGGSLSSSRSASVDPDQERGASSSTNRAPGIMPPGRQESWALDNEPTSETQSLLLDQPEPQLQPHQAYWDAERSLVFFVFSIFGLFFSLVGVIDTAVQVIFCVDPQYRKLLVGVLSWFGCQSISIIVSFILVSCRVQFYKGFWGILVRIYLAALVFTGFILSWRMTVTLPTGRSILRPGALFLYSYSLVSWDAFILDRGLIPWLKSPWSLGSRKLIGWWSALAAWALELV